MINLIGLSGYAFSGKSTVGSIIQYLTSESSQKRTYEEFLSKGQGNNDFQTWYNSDWEIKGFATKLKKIASLLTGIPEHKFDDPEFKKSFLPKEWNIHHFVGKGGGTAVLPKYGGEIKERQMSVREFLQKLGTDAVRNVLGEDVWVNALFSEYVPSIIESSEDKRILSIWKNMRTRCTNPKYEKWEKYGGRGISICSEWDNFYDFERWAIKNGYTNDLTLDREDVDGNYTPENCRWVTSDLQAFNKNSYNGSTSPFRGVSLRPNGSWMAQIQYKGEKMFIGYFRTQEEASKEYEKEYTKIKEELEKESKRRLRQEPSKWIITDCRFANEAHAIKDRGGIMVRIHRPPQSEGESMNSTHISERALDDWSFDWEIDNDEDIPSLIKKTKEMLQHFKLIT